MHPSAARVQAASLLPTSLAASVVFALLALMPGATSQRYVKGALQGSTLQAVAGCTAASAQQASFSRRQVDRVVMLV